MKDPQKYMSLLDFFLKKRDPNRGGVDGYYTDFKFTLHELSANGVRIRTDADLKEKLKTLQREPCKDLYGQKTTVIGAFVWRNGEYVISEAPTIGLQEMRDRLLRSQTKSWFKIEPLPGWKANVTFADMETKLLLSKRRLVILSLLIKHFRKYVTYKSILYQINGARGGKWAYDNDPAKALKQVQDDVAGLRDRLNEVFDFEGNGAIDNIANKGYLLYR